MISYASTGHVMSIKLQLKVKSRLKSHDKRHKDLMKLLRPFKF